MKKCLIAILCVIVCSMALMACSAKAIAAPSNITYDGVNITWDAVEDADHYLINLDEGADQKVTGTSHAFDSKGANFTFKVKAVPKTSKLKKREASDASSVSFKPLPTINAVTASATGEVSWTAIDGATGYRVSINNVVVPRVISGTTYQLEAGDSSVMVRPIVADDNSYYSKWSAAKQYKMFEAPLELAYNSQTISWAAVNGATKYVLKINDQEIEVNNSTSYAYEGSEGALMLSVRAIGNGVTTFSSAYCTTREFGFLAPINAVVLENGIVKWDAITNAEKYWVEVSINGVVNKVHKDIVTNQFSNLQPSTSYSIRVLAIAEKADYFSKWSQAINVYFLSKPSVEVTVSESKVATVSWLPSLNDSSKISGYKLKVTLNGTDKAINIGSETLSTATISEEILKFDIAGEYMVSVTALSAAEGYGDSVYSDIITIKKLATVTNLSSAYTESGNTITANLSYSVVAGAKGYIINTDGSDKNVTSVSSGITVNNNNGAENASIFKVRAKGDANGTYKAGAIKLVALESDPSAEYKVTKLATPTNLNISGHKISFDAVDKNSGYIIDASGSKFVTANNSNIEFPSVSAGQHSIKVKAVGNGTNIITSDLSAGVNVKKLTAPTGITVSAVGVLTWSAVDGTTNYTLNGIGDAISVDSSTNYNIFNSITVAGININIYARGDGNATINSEPSANIRVFKLPTPDGLEVDDSNIRWNAVSLAQNYRVIVNGSNIVSGNVVATSISTSLLAVGDNTITVQAFRNSVMTEANTFYIDSDKTAIVSRTKLSVPTLSIDSGRAMYKWNAIDSAAGYEIVISGFAPIAINNNVTQFDPAEYFKTATTYKVQIRARGVLGTSISSDFSELSQVVSAVGLPTIAHSYNLATREITFTASCSGICNNAGYIFTAGGVVQNVDGNSFSITASADGGSYKGAAVCKGGAFGNLDNSTFYINSNPAEVTVKVLAKPYDIAVDKQAANNNYVVSFVSQATNNLVTIKINGTVVDGYNAKSTTDRRIIITANVGDEITVEITAVPSGEANTYASQATTFTKIV